MNSTSKVPSHASFCNVVQTAFDLPPGTSIDLSAPLKEDLNWNSINVVMLMAMIESEYGVLLPVESIRQCDNLEQVFLLLQSHLVGA
jgi:acyl carrier protein